MKVLVVGGAGYIGGSVTDVLIKNGVGFSVYDELLYEQQYLKPVDFIRGDVRDREKLKSILSNYSHVIWLAAIVGDAACQVQPEITIKINQESVGWLAKNFDGRIIFTSTCSVYGQSTDLINEESPTNPLSLYAKSKIQAEKYLSGKKNCLIFRLGTAFGVSDYFSRLRMDLVVNYMTANALTKGSLTVFGGTQWRPLIHVKDIGATIVDNLQKPTMGIYNVAAVNSQIKDLAVIVSKMTGCEIKYGEQKFEDQRNYHVSTEKALKAGVLKSGSLRSIENGVEEIINLVKGGRIKYTENDIYFNERHLNNLNKNGQFK